MTGIRRLLFAVLATAAIGLAAEAAGPQSALAYLDAGTGSLVFQWLIAGVVAGGLAIKLFWGRIASLFGRKPAQPEDD